MALLRTYRLAAGSYRLRSALVGRSFRVNRETDTYGTPMPNGAWHLFDEKAEANGRDGYCQTFRTLREATAAAESLCWGE
jgi:hypothetical protein